MQRTGKPVTLGSAVTVTGMGEVQATPTSNTLLGRLKDLLTGIILAAGTNLIGKISAGIDTSVIYNGTTALTPKFAPIACSSSGANAIVAAVEGKKIRVISYLISCNGAVNAKWQSASTDKTGLLYMDAAGKGAVGPANPIGHFETVANEALNLNLSGAVAVGGHITYVEV